MFRRNAHAICSPGDAPIGGFLFTAPDWVWGEPLTFSDDGEFQAAYLVFLEQMVSTSPEDVTIWIVTHERTLPKVRDWAIRSAFSQRVHAFSVDDRCRFTVWARDLFLVTRNHSVLTALAPCKFPRADDEELARRAAIGVELSFARSDLFFQGGNVVADDRAILIGADDPNIFLRSKFNASSGLTQAEYSRRVCPVQSCLVLGSREWTCMETIVPLRERLGWRERRFAGSPPESRQPAYHLDMYISPLGNGEIAVGDTALARGMASHSLVDEGINAALDETAETLANFGYEVTRAPLPILPHDDAEARLRTWYLASPFNTIADPWTQTVWLPLVAGSTSDRALKNIDDFHAAIWRKAGYRTIGLLGLDPILQRLGGPRCLAQVLPRY